MDNSMQPMIDFPTSALMTSKDSSILSYSRGGGRSGHRGCGGRRFTKRGRGSGSQTYQPHQNNQFTRPCSQICNRIGHTTLDCYHRMDYSFQGKNPPEKLVVMATSYNPVGEQTWFVDSGATNHITNDLRNLSIHLGYQGTDKVSIGILNSGSSVILTPSCSFKFNNVLHVLEISSNLLSVNQFAKDNKCVFDLDSTVFQIQD